MVEERVRRGHESAARGSPHAAPARRSQSGPPPGRPRGAWASRRAVMMAECVCGAPWAGSGPSKTARNPLADIVEGGDPAGRSQLARGVMRETWSVVAPSTWAWCASSDATTVGIRPAGLDRGSGAAACPWASGNVDWPLHGRAGRSTRVAWPVPAARWRGRLHLRYQLPSASQPDRRAGVRPWRHRPSHCARASACLVRFAR
jgi:hypothetical protein